MKNPSKDSHFVLATGFKQNSDKSYTSPSMTLDFVPERNWMDTLTEHGEIITQTECMRLKNKVTFII